MDFNKYKRTGILQNKIEMAILYLIRFGPQTLINNLINFQVS